MGAHERPWLGPTRERLEEVARHLGLDMKQFGAALDVHRHKSRVVADVQLANTVGANGTPTFFINGRRFVGAQPLERFKAAFAEEMARAEKWQRAGYRGATLRDALLSEAPSLPDL